MSGAGANTACMQAKHIYNSSGVCTQKRCNACRIMSYLEFAAVKLQQSPVREEQLTADDSSPQAARAAKPFLLHYLRLPSSFQHHRLVRVRAPGTRRWRPCLWDDKHELLQDVLQVGGTLGCRLDCRDDAVAEVQVAVGLCCNEVHVRNRLLNSDRLYQLFCVGDASCC